MTKRTEWLELPEAIEFVGPLIFPEWTGHKRRAPTHRELSAEIAHLHELTPKQLATEYAAWRTGIEAEAERERVARQAGGAKPSGIREGLEKLHSQLTASRTKRVGVPCSRRLKVFLGNWPGLTDHLNLETRSRASAESS